MNIQLGVESSEGNPSSLVDLRKGLSSYGGREGKGKEGKDREGEREGETGRGREG